MKNEQPTFQFSDFRLPPSDEFPINDARQDGVTENFVRTDFDQSKDYLIITGFSSLDYLIRFFLPTKKMNPERVRIVLGNEPIVREYRKQYTVGRIKEEIKDYWLEKGVSVIYGGNILHLIELIKNGLVEFYCLENLHGKLYVGDTHAIIGSSNFSRSGLRMQKEANKRCEKGTSDFEHIQSVANHYLNQAQSYNKEMIELLEQLLRCVSWQEALSRAIAELTEGDWIKKNPKAFGDLSELKLWGAQMQAIGQALYILDNHGGLLVADPTGAGKTRLGVALKLSILNRLWKNGRGGRSKTLLLCPSSVKNNWEKEADQLFYNNMNIITHAQVSDRENSSNDLWRNQLTKTDVLMIDEAHNFLRTSSKRSKNIMLNNADHVILLTATPINKKEEDLFRLIEIMDVDNLSDEVIEKFEYVRMRRRYVKKEEIDSFRKVLRNFTIRRTKKDLNRIIDRNPELYLNRLGQQCRFPQHICKTYSLNESQKDIELMEQINELAKKLKGIIWLRRLELNDYELGDAEMQQKIIEGRLKAAKGLAGYYIQNRIRSSRPALVEHLKGKKAAYEFVGLKRTLTTQDKKRKPIIDEIHKHKESLPIVNAEVGVPGWLTDLELYQKACDEEIDTYEKILNLTMQMSSQREMTKAKKLLGLLGQHNMLLAFDGRLISLHYINSLIQKINPQSKTIVVTGAGGKKKKEDALEVFGLESKEKGWIGLCSDAMAEGVNMQSASALMFLDMPSVMRLAEQRIGRIDRMDSPHLSIEIYWADDHDAFALRTDVKFFKTVKTVRDIIGSNIEVPELLTGNILKADAAIKLHEDKQENEDRYSDEIQDAFQQVRNLKEGDLPLVYPKTYEDIRLSKANVFSHVSFVKSSAPFGFFALKGEDKISPRWLMIEGNKISTDLAYICERLRFYLVNTENMDAWDDSVSELMNHFISQLKKSQIEKLPNKKRRALQLLKKVVEERLKNKGRYKNAENVQLKSMLTRFLDILNINRDDEDFGIDYYQLATNWIDTIQPLINAERQKSKRRKLIHFGNFDKQLKGLSLTELGLEELEKNLEIVAPLDKRVVACVIGVSGN